MKHLTTLFLCTLILGSVPFSHAASGGDQKKVKSFTVSKGGTLEVSVGGGDLRITPWDKNEVSVTVEGLNYDDESELSITQSGNSVRVTDGGGWGDASRFSISVPAQFNLDLNTAGGDIAINGNVVGDISGQTSAGDVRLADVEGKVEVRTSGGDIRTGKITGTGSLSTSGGEIDVASSTGELEVKSSGGDLRVGNVGKWLRAKTAGGDILIGDVGGEAVVATAGGNVRVGKVSGQATLSTSGGDVELSGGSGVIKASTSGGNVSLTNISGSVTATTSGGDVYAELVPGGKGTSKLASAAGKVTLLVPESAKATISARIRIRGRMRSSDENYSIRSDFKEAFSSHNKDDREITATYVLNGGGESITLETVNSDIEIRKLRR